jgi:hypothetical protein
VKVLTVLQRLDLAVLGLALNAPTRLGEAPQVQESSPDGLQDIQSTLFCHPTVYSFDFPLILEQTIDNLSEQISKNTISMSQLNRLL